MPILRFKSSWIFTLLLLLGGVQVMTAQQTDFLDIRPKQNSPLSRFGLGDALDQHFAAQAGMGGIQSVYQDAYQVNLLNPASLASLAATSLEIGLYGKLATLKDANGSVDTESGNLSYMALAFPLRNPINMNLDRQSKHWNAGMAFSLAPTTLVGYDLELEEEVEGVGVASNLLRGTGGTYQASWAGAYRYRNFSAGFKLNYNFGQISNGRVVVLDSIRTSLATEFSEEFSVSGLNLGYGFQYAINLKKDGDGGERVNSGKRIILGVNGKLQSDLTTNSSTLFRRFSNNSAVFLNDTLSSQESQRGSLTLPTEINFGVAYEDFNHLFIGAEFGRAAWNNYRNDVNPDERLSSTNRFAFGIQYIPDANSYNSFWKRLRYRAGVRLSDDPRVLDNVQGRKQAVTFGLGIPILLPRQQVSFFNFAVEMGKFGVPDVLDENYIQFTVGFSLNDNSWFYKRKFN
jgi:hypothetical protein